MPVEAIPSATPPTAGSPLTAVANAIRKAAQATGASFDYLLTTAKVESNLNPNLSTRTSSATGLFQFIEQTWLGMMKEAGKALGFGRYADAITETGSGRFVVADPAMRREIMGLRKDPATSAALGGAFTQQNAAILSQSLGRKPTDGELYIAHFFGPASAAKVIRAATSHPSANAAEMFPAAAQANHSIFYTRQGRPRSIAGVYHELVRRYQVAHASTGVRTALASAAPAAAPGFFPSHSVQRVAATASGHAAAFLDLFSSIPDNVSTTQAAAAANLSPPAQPSGKPPDDGPVFLSLFQTDTRRGAVSPAVAALWGGDRAHLRSSAAEETTALSYAPVDGR
jgi:hypothetical protein